MTLNTNTTTPLLPLVEKYFETDPVGAAHHLETMSEEEAVSILKTLPPRLSAEVVHHLPESFTAILLRHLPPDIFKDIVERLDAQQCTTIFLHLPSEKRYQLLGLLDEGKKKEIRELLTYPEDSAGRVMTTDFIAFHSALKVKDAIHKIRQLAQRGAPASYIYVVDKDNHLVGVMNMRDMMLSPDEARLESVMRKEVFAVNCVMDRERVAEELSSRRYFAVPVVDAENRLLGVVKAEQLLEDVQEEATEDIQKMFGAGGDERVFSPFIFSLSKRLPWLHVNLATAFLAAGVIAIFEDVIAKITALAVFLPVVAGQGGNAGAQSLAVVMRGLVMREIPPAKVRKLILKEMTLGAVNGLIIGVVTALIAWVWKGNPYLGMVIGLAMVANMVIAGLAGAAIPLTMKAVGLDPAQCSNIILTTVTDVMGFFTFLGFAVLFQSYLI